MSSIGSKIIDAASSVVEEHVDQRNVTGEASLIAALNGARDLYVYAALGNERKKCLQVALARIYEQLWPTTDPLASWNSDTLDGVASVFRDVLNMKTP